MKAPLQQIVPAVALVAIAALGAGWAAACSSSRAATEPAAGGATTPRPAATVSPAPAGTGAGAVPGAKNTGPPVAVSAAGTADGALRAFDRAFLRMEPGGGYYRLSTTGGSVTFFKQAELIEMTEDAWVRTHDPRYKRQIALLYRGLVAHNGSGLHWLHETNDDLMWATVMCLRAYAITGSRSYLTQAKLVFDATYARAWSTALGGGLWNTPADLTKNTCVTAPAVIAACLLYRDLHQQTYLTKAESLYAWLRGTLFDPATGQVYDHVTPTTGGGSTLDTTSWTYNQGGMIGAADLLQQITGKRQYLRDAVAALAYARDHLTTGGILRSELSQGAPSTSAGGFKGMFVRWAAMFCRDQHVTGYTGWFRQNVAAVEAHLNPAGLMDQDWTVQTGSGPLLAFSCSSAVVLLQWYSPAGG